MGSDGRPAISNRVARLALKYSLRICKIIVNASHKCLTVGIKTVDRLIYGVESKVISSFLIFGLVVNCAALDLYLTCVEVSLEVGAVVLSVPKAPLNEGEKLESLLFAALVLENYLLNFTCEVLRNKESNFSGKTVLLALDNCVAHTVTAYILIKLSLYGRPAGIPYSAVIVYVEIASACICGNVVVTVTCDSCQTSVLIEAVSACCVGNKAEKVLCSKIVYPRIRGFGRCDNILLGSVIKETEFH